ncbi:MAG TPA: hypothetical protein VFB24_18775, partial [Candidatus Binatia bacterium]|nr:hypothetical protein [Candidatus Binatia bacterium]
GPSNWVCYVEAPASGGFSIHRTSVSQSQQQPSASDDGISHFSLPFSLDIPSDYSPLALMNLSPTVGQLIWTWN